MDVETLALYQKVMDEGIIFLNKKKRNVACYRGHYFNVTKIVYFLYHPWEDNLGPNEELHHLDWNAINDHPDNLARVTHDWHVAHHKKARVPASVKELSHGVVQQIRNLWLAGIRKTKAIWQAMSKVIPRCLITQVVNLHQAEWQRYLNAQEATT